MSRLPVDQLVPAIHFEDRRRFSLANEGFRKLVEERGLLEYKIKKEYSIESGFVHAIGNNVNNVRRKIELRNEKVIGLILSDRDYVNINSNALGPHIQELDLFMG